MNTSEAKSVARKAAFERRKRAFGTVQADLLSAIEPLVIGAEILAFYMPMRTEINPISAMKALAGAGKRICVPVILGYGRPLEFREWSPDVEMEEGEFGALIPVRTQVLIPEIVFAPLVAFDDEGARLGYGGGFYDRTLEALRKEDPTPYIGLAFEAQRSPNPLPLEATDIPLDGVVTEKGYHNIQF